MKKNKTSRCSITVKEIFKRKPQVKKELWEESFGLMDTLCSNGWGKGKLGNSGKVYTRTGETKRGVETNKAVLS